MKKLWIKTTLNDIFIVQAVCLDRKPSIPTTPRVFGQELMQQDW
jgi:hypothetical protein